MRSGLLVVAMMLCCSCSAFGYGDVADSESGGCQVAITNGLVSIREQPDVFSQEIVSVPRGTYEVLETTSVDRAGQSSRWLLIDIDGRSGWVRDDSFTINQKSPACP